MAEQTPVQTLEDIRRLRPQIMALAQRHRAYKVAVFGSVVRGEMRADSDIDFLVDFESDFRLTDIIRLAQCLEDLLGRKVDLVPKHALRKELQVFVTSELQAL